MSMARKPKSSESLLQSISACTERLFAGLLLPDDEVGESVEHGVECGPEA